MQTKLTAIAGSGILLIGLGIGGVSLAASGAEEITAVSVTFFL